MTEKRMTEDQARNLRESPLWESLKVELDYRIMTKLMALKRCTAEQVSSIQAEIRVYEEIIALPEGVINRETTKETR